jgi:DNA-binding protein Fis
VTSPAAGPAAAGSGWSVEEFVRGLLRGYGRDVYEEVHREADRVVLPLVLAHAEGNQSRAAEVLGIARKTHRTRLSELELGVTRRVETDDAD